MDEITKYMNTHEDLYPAIQEIERELLQVISEDIARLVYLASTRDYNASRYHHDFLAFHYPEEMVDQALAACHREVFTRLALSPLAVIVQQLKDYLSSVMVPLADVLHMWSKLAPYRVLPPCDCEPLVAELFFSNIRIALALLQAHQEATPGRRESVQTNDRNNEYA